MITALSHLFYRHASWQTIVPLLLVCAGYFWVFNFSSLPFSNPALVAIGCGQGLLDLRAYYDANAAYQALQCYGEKGRAVYRHFLLADMSFLCCYGTGFSLLLSRQLAALIAPASRWRLANLLPLGVAFADAMENLLIFSLLVTFPHPFPILGNWAGLATLIKSILIGASLATLAGSAGIRLFTRR